MSDPKHMYAMEFIVALLNELENKGIFTRDDCNRVIDKANTAFLETYPEYEEIWNEDETTVGVEGDTHENQELGEKDG